jgi:hypothetical protein
MGVDGKPRPEWRSHYEVASFIRLLQEMMDKGTGVDGLSFSSVAAGLVGQGTDLDATSGGHGASKVVARWQGTVWVS